MVEFKYILSASKAAGAHITVMGNPAELVPYRPRVLKPMAYYAHVEAAMSSRHGDRCATTIKQMFQAKKIVLRRQRTTRVNFLVWTIAFEETPSLNSFRVSVNVGDHQPFEINFFALDQIDVCAVCSQEHRTPDCDFTVTL